MSGEAIQFSIGGDNSGLVRVLQDSERRAKAAAGTINESLRGAGAGANHAAEGFERFLAREGKVKRSLVELAQLGMSGASGFELLGQGAERLEGIFRTSLGIGVTVAAASVFIDKIGKAVEKTNQLAEATENLQKKLRTPVAFQTADQLQKTADEAASMHSADMKDVANEQTIPGAVGAVARRAAVGPYVKDISWTERILRLMNPFYGADSQGADEERRRGETQKLFEEARAKIAEKLNAALDITEKGSFLGGSQADAEQDRIQSRADEQKGAVRDNPALAKAIQRGADIESKLSKWKYQDATDANTHQNRLTRIGMRDGSAVDVARENLEFAKLEEGQARSRSKEEHEIAEVKLHAAELALRDAEREQEMADHLARVKTDSLREQIAGHTEIAKQMERQLAIETEAVKLDRAGLHEQAQQVRNQGSLQNYAENFARAYDPRKGRIDTDAALDELRSRHNAEAKQAAAKKQFDEAAGFLPGTVHRNMHGDVIGGIDPRTGNFVGSHDNNGPTATVDANGNRVWSNGASGLGGSREKSMTADELRKSWEQPGGHFAPKKAGDRAIEEGSQAQASKGGDSDKTKAGHGDAMQKMAASLNRIDQRLGRWDQ